MGGGGDLHEVAPHVMQPRQYQPHLLQEHDRPPPPLQMSTMCASWHMRQACIALTSSDSLSSICKPYCSLYTVSRPCDMNMVST